MDVIWVSVSCLQPRSSFVSVVFDFNNSLNDFAPVSLMLLPVYMKINEKSELLMDIICVCCLSFVFTPQIEFRECCV